LFALWIAAGVVLALRRDLLREHARRRRFRRPLAIALFVSGAGVMLAALWAVAGMNGLTPNGLNFAAMALLGFGGIVFVSLQTLGLAYLVVDMMEMVTTERRAASELKRNSSDEASH
jgi:hypothetical protein